MITAEISRFMDENVHRSVQVVCLGNCEWVRWFGIFDSSLAVNYRTFGSGRQKLVDIAAMNNANDVILLRRQSSLTCSWDARQCIFTSNFDIFWGIWPVCGRPSCGPQKGTFLRDCA